MQVLAQRPGFIKRHRKFDALSCIRMSLFDHFEYKQPSLQQHLLSLYKAGMGSISKQAVNKQFTQYSLVFIKELFEILLRHQQSGSGLPSYLYDHFTSVKVMDSTEFKLPDHFAEAFPATRVIVGGRVPPFS